MSMAIAWRGTRNEGCREGSVQMWRPRKRAVETPQKPPPDGGKIADVACAGGAIYDRKLGADGADLPFPLAYPSARDWLKRLAE